MAASGARPAWQVPGGTASAEIETGVVDVLDRSPTLMGESSRHLLLRMVERRIGGPLQVPDYPVRRQWFAGLVDACRVRPEGLAALAAAVADLEPASPTAAAVRRLSVEWNSDAEWSFDVGSAAAEPGAMGTWPGARAVAGSAARPCEPELPAGQRRHDHDSPPVAHVCGALSPAQVRTLAEVFHRATAARQVLAAAGLPPGRQPIWSDMSPAEFWGEVNHLLAAGVLRDGRRRVLAAAAELFPANPVFAARTA